MTIATIETPTMNDPLATDAPTATATILQRCVCVVLTCSAIGTQKKVALGALQIAKDGVALTEKEQKQLRMRKAIYDSDDLAPVRAVLSDAKAFVTARSASSHRVFGPGTRLIPLALYGELRARWPEIVEERRLALGKFFDAGDFVSADDLVDEFSLDWLPIAFSAPDRLKGVDDAAYEESSARWNEKYRAAYDELILDAREQALGVMRELADRLSGETSTGKPRALRPSALRDIQELIALLPKKNVGGDDPLADSLAKVAVLADGMSVETLNAAPGVRQMLRQEAERAVAALDGLVTDAKVRAIKFRKAAADAA